MTNCNVSNKSKRCVVKIDPASIEDIKISTKALINPVYTGGYTVTVHKEGRCRHVKSNEVTAIWQSERSAMLAVREYNQGIPVIMFIGTNMAEPLSSV